MEQELFASSLISNHDYNFTLTSGCNGLLARRFRDKPNRIPIAGELLPNGVFVPPALPLEIE